MHTNRTVLISIISVVLLVVVAFLAYLWLKPNDEAEARAIATEFVQKLQHVSLTAEEEAVRAAIGEQYGPYVTEELLAQWQENPSEAPGRAVSSPWPDRIFIKNIERQGESFVINADILYVTSAEVESPEEDAAGVMVVVMQLIPTDDGWRIAAFEELFGEDLEELASSVE